MNPNKDFKIKDIKYVQTSDGEYPNDKTESVLFRWGIEGFGFGETSFYYDEGKLKCKNETLSKKDIKKILCAFVDRAEFMEF